MTDPAPAAAPAPTPTAGAPAPGAAAPAPVAAADTSLLDPSHDNTKPGGDGSGKDPNASAGGSPKPAAGAQDPSKAAADAAEAAAAAAKGAPEKYTDFKVPEGVKLDPAVATEFQAVAKGLGLSQEAAQKLVDFQSKAALDQVKQLDANVQETKKAWEAQIRKELGNSFDAERAFVAKGRDWNADPELLDLLNKSGLGSHPAVFKHFAKLGKAVAEDGFVEGKPAGAGGGPTLKPTAEVLFGNTPPKK